MTASNPLSDRLSTLSREDRARLFERLHGRRERGQRIAPRLPSALPPPLSFAQQRLWFLDQLNPGDVAYNIFFPVFLGGPLVPPALAAALAGVVARHQSLRTTFVLAGAEPAQRIAPASRELHLPLIDLSRLGLPDPRALGDVGPELARLAAGEERWPFDLARGPLLRATLVRLGEESHVLLLNMHHIVSDGWSTGILVREMSALYRAALAGDRPPLPPLPLQYADFALWQRTHLTGPVLAAQVAFWRQYLDGAPAVLPLPLDRPRPRIKTTAGRQLKLDLAHLHAPLKELALRLGVTPFIVLMAAFQAFLGRYTGLDDLTVGTPIANRQKREIEGLIGFFVNTVVMRGRLAGDPAFLELVERVRQDALAVFSHQDLPFEKLVEELQPERDPSRSPIFQALLVVQNVPGGKPKDEQLVIDEVPLVRRSTKFDLTVGFDEAEDTGWRGSLAYNRDLFDAATAERLGRHLLTLLAGALAEPGRRLADLPLFAPAEIEALRALGEGPRLAAAPSLLERIAAQVEHAPGALAVRFEDGGAGAGLTYGELWQRVGESARRLRRRGVGAETVVGLALDRSLELIVEMLAVLAASGAYLPLDPQYPRERLAFMLEDSGARWVVAGDGEIEDLGGKDEDKDLKDGAGDPLPGSLAYVIYTSGSTGVPKGVLVSRRALATLAAAVERFGVGPGDRVLLFASPSFDASLLDVALALGQGATLVLAPKSLLLPGLELAASLEAWGITHLHLPPSALAALPVAPLPALRALILGGEPCPPALAAQWAAGRTIWNDYGPTEAAVFATAGPMGAGPVELGETVAGDDLLLLDAQGTPVPLGAPGEIGLGGSGLARGYRGRPELTASRFVPHPFSGRGAEAGARLYRTGDLARRTPHGGLEYLGRADRQIKVRGFRVEPGEIEAVLAGHDAVRQVAVVARQERDFRSVMTACVVYSGDEAGEPAGAADELRRYTEERLPAYLVPRGFVFLPQLPVLPSGKVDRRALEGLAAAGARAAQGPLVAPRSDLERQVAAIWEEALGVAVGAEDNFFDLGGHSLLLTRVQLELHRLLGRDVPLLALFEHTTVRSLALHLEGEPPGLCAAAVVDSRDRAARQREAALAQRRRLVGQRAS
jgi:amino acid adenylation domain-containing protein